MSNKKELSLIGKDLDVENLKEIICSRRSCPYCGSVSVVSKGFRENGIKRFKCKECNKSFSSVTGTIFDKTKIPISTWITIIKNMICNKSIQKTIIEIENEKDAVSLKAVAEAELEILEAVSLLPEEPLSEVVELVTHPGVKFRKHNRYKIKNLLEKILFEDDQNLKLDINYDCFIESEENGDIFLDEEDGINDTTISEEIDSLLRDYIINEEEWNSEISKELNMTEECEELKNIHFLHDINGTCLIKVFDVDIYTFCNENEKEVIANELKNCKVVFCFKNQLTDDLIANHHILHIPFGFAQFYFEYVKKSDDEHLLQIIEKYNPSFSKSEIKSYIEMLKRDLNIKRNSTLLKAFNYTLNRQKSGVRNGNVEKWLKWFSYLNNKFYKNELLINEETSETMAIEILIDIYCNQIENCKFFCNK